MKNSESVKKFYDEFAGRMLLNDFHNYNLRHSAIKNFCDNFIPAGSRILEIGCGLGIISKHLQKKALSITALDISEQNIKIASSFAAKSNSLFRVLNVIDDVKKIKNFGKFDVVVIFDVIEHISQKLYKNLFELIESVLSENGTVLLSYPSPEYQMFLKGNKSEALQIIDETVFLNDILNSTKLFLYYFSYKNVWDYNQYIHLVLKKNIDYYPKFKLKFWSHINYKIKKYSWRYSHKLFKIKAKKILSGRY